jgi:hypothetical protein
MFGQWPIDTFNELSAEQQVAVWQSGNSMQAMQAALVEEVSKQRVDEEIRRTAGSFMPLSVYAATGYTADMIAKIELGCEKRFDNELQEWTYKKTIHTDVKDVVTRKVREELLNLRHRDLPRDANPVKQSRKRKDRSSSSSDSSKSSKKSRTCKSEQKSDSSKSSKKSKSSSSSSDSPNTIRVKATAARKERLKAAAVAKTMAALLAKQEKAAAAAARKEQAKDPMRLSCTCICTSIKLNTR